LLPHVLFVVTKCKTIPKCTVHYTNYIHSLN